VFSQYHSPREIYCCVAGNRLPASYGLSSLAVVVLQQIMCSLLHHILTWLSACRIQPLSPAEQSTDLQLTQFKIALYFNRVSSHWCTIAHGLIVLRSREGRNVLHRPRWTADQAMPYPGVKVKAKFILQQATKAWRGSRGIALLLP